MKNSLANAESLIDKHSLFLPPNTRRKTSATKSKPADSHRGHTDRAHVKAGRGAAPDVHIQISRPTSSDSIAPRDTPSYDVSSEALPQLHSESYDSSALTGWNGSSHSYFETESSLFDSDMPSCLASNTTNTTYSDMTDALADIGGSWPKCKRVELTPENLPQTRPRHHQPQSTRSAMGRLAHMTERRSIGTSTTEISYATSLYSSDANTPGIYYNSLSTVDPNGNRMRADDVTSGQSVDADLLRHKQLHIMNSTSNLCPICLSNTHFEPNEKFPVCLLDGDGYVIIGNHVVMKSKRIVAAEADSNFNDVIHRLCSKCKTAPLAAALGKQLSGSEVHVSKTKDKKQSLPGSIGGGAPHRNSSSSSSGSRRTSSQRLMRTSNLPVLAEHQAADTRAAAERVPPQQATVDTSTTGLVRPVNAQTSTSGLEHDTGVCVVNSQDPQGQSASLESLRVPTNAYGVTKSGSSESRASRESPSDSVRSSCDTDSDASTQRVTAGGGGGTGANSDWWISA